MRNKAALIAALSAAAVALGPGARADAVAFAPHTVHAEPRSLRELAVQTATGIPPCRTAFRLRGNVSAYGDEDDLQLTYAAVLTNPSRRLLAAGIGVTLRLLDDGHRPVFVIHDTISFLPPGSSTAVALSDSAARVGHVFPGRRIDEARVFTLDCSVRAWYRVTRPLPKLVASHAHTQTINFMDTTATITSTFPNTVHNTTLVAVFRDASGRILGGSSACVDDIAPGTDSGYDAGEIFDPVPGVASTEAYVQWLPPLDTSHLCGEVVSVPRLGARPFPGLIGPLQSADAGTYWP
jgi:hypothetical protein